jgi:two-component system chemotaxis response regulator CheY
MEQNKALRMKDGQPVRYLVVDDSLFARKNLGRILAMFDGVVSGEAGHGRAAIEEYDRLRPDVVLMDVTMPEMEGMEAAARIIGQHPGARIVMVSSVGDQDNISDALRKGALHFVQKPVQPELLHAVIKRVIEAETPAALAGARS